MNLIPVFRPNFGPEELESVRQVFESGWIGLGPRTRQFEEEFAAYVGAKHAIALNSATAALHLGLLALNVEGGEVITTSMTFVSTNHAILYCGARPVFVDVEPDTLNMDVEQVAKAITPRTKAIIPVHYGGHPCDLDAIRALADKHGLAVLEDAAHACGSLYKGKSIGSLSELTSFSFHAVKNLACGDGGMLTTDDDALAERLRRLRWVGITRDTWNRSEHGKYSWYYDVVEVGYKYHMNDIIAAIALTQLGKLPSANQRRRDIARQYREGLGDLNWVEFLTERPYAFSAQHNVVIKAEDRDRLMEYLKELGISTGVHYYPNHLYDMYAPYRQPLPVVEREWLRLVTLPCYPDLTDEQVSYIIECIRSFRPEFG